MQRNLCVFKSIFYMWQWEESAPTSHLTHTKTAQVCNCLLGFVHLVIFLTHGVPLLMKPCDDGTIILLIRIALGAVWEQLG